MTVFKQAALKYLRFANIIPVTAKKTPLGAWEKWATERITENDINNFTWENAKGIAIISGIENLRVLDFDHVDDVEIIYEALKILELDKDYSWVVESGSKEGYHIYFKCSMDFPAKEIGRQPSSYYKLKAKESCDHIELRWNNCYTIVPPSYHPTGNRYIFCHLPEKKMPKAPPSEVAPDKILNLLNELCIIEKPQFDKIIASKEDDGFIEISDLDYEILQSAIDVLKTQKLGYDNWYRCGFALASLGEEGRKYFVDLSLNNPNYNDTELFLQKKFDNFLKDKRNHINIGTLFHIAEGFGFNWPQNNRTSIKTGKARSKLGVKVLKVKKYLLKKYEFKHNKLTDKIEWRKRNSGEFKEMENDDLNSLYFEISEKVVDFSYDNISRLLYSEFTPKYHPLFDYFNSLEPWDGKDHIWDLSTTILTDDISLFNKYFKKWLIAVVAGVFDPVWANHTALILQGNQGVGKSRWLERLVPDSLKSYYYSGSLDPKDKDSKFNVVSNFLINLDELETSSRGEFGHLKHLITTKQLQLRRPYGRLTEKYVKRSSFMGSVNKTEFLNDPTGNRRFLIFSTDVVDYEHNVDIDKVYAQALHLYRSGEQYWLNSDEIKEVNERNEEFQFKTKEEELIQRNFEPAPEDDPMARAMMTSEIAELILGSGGYTNSNIYLIGQALTKLKFEKKAVKRNGHTRKCWIVKRIDPLSANNDNLSYKEGNLPI